MQENAEQITLDFANAHQLRELTGEFGAHLKRVAREMDVQVTQRGTSVLVSGEPDKAALTADLLRELYALGGAGRGLDGNLVEHACRLKLSAPQASVSETFSDIITVGQRKKPIFPRNLTQKAYVEAIRGHDIVFGLGPAGTGKTYLAVAMAVAALARGDVQRLILCRPAVEAGEKLGFLPGDLVEKVNPYLRPLYDGLHDMLGMERVGRLLERGVIEVAPLAFMRGRTLSDAFVILDEAQNTTREQMKMFLTRLGMGSRAVITGDLSQIDLPRPNHSGLVEVNRILRGIPQIGFVEFTAADVVRHALVSAIIRAYDRARQSAGADS